jgi:hypothetical protein
MDIFDENPDPYALKQQLVNLDSYAEENIKIPINDKHIEQDELVMLLENHVAFSIKHLLHFS